MFTIIKEIKNPIHYSESQGSFSADLSTVVVLKDQYKKYIDEIASQIFALKTFLREDPFINCLERTIFSEFKRALNIPICEFEEEFLNKPKKTRFKNEKKGATLRKTHH